MQKIIAIVLIVISGLISGIACAYSLSLREAHISILDLGGFAILAFLPFVIPILCVKNNSFVTLLVVLCAFALSYKGSEIYYHEIVLSKDPSYSFTVLIVPFILQAPLFLLMASFVAVFYNASKPEIPESTTKN